MSTHRRGRRRSRTERPAGAHAMTKTHIPAVSRARRLLAGARACLLLLVLLVVATGGNAPPSSQPATEGNQGTPWSALQGYCPAPDASGSPFPADLAPSGQGSGFAIPGTFDVSPTGAA